MTGRVALRLASLAVATAGHHVPRGTSQRCRHPEILAASGEYQALDRRGPGTCGCHSMARMAVFQAVHAGSIPVIRSRPGPGLRGKFVSQRLARLGSARIGRPHRGGAVSPWGLAGTMRR